VALGDSRADNATALITMRDAALMPLQIIKNRFYVFLEETARIWSDFWINYYGIRSIKLKDKAGIRYISFNGERYKGLAICAKVEISNETVYSNREKADMLITLYEKGIINRKQLLMRLPGGIISETDILLKEMEEESNERV